MNAPATPTIGCMTRPFVARGATFEEALERIARAGYRSVHFGPFDRRANGEPVVPAGATREQLSSLAELCARHGLAVASMFTRRPEDLSVETVDTYRADIDVCKALGATILVMWGPSPYRQGLQIRRPRADVLAHYERWFAGIPALAAHALSRGVTIALKPHMGLTATSWEQLDTLARINSPAVRACYDGGNVHYYEGIKPEEDIKEIAAQTVHLCVKDHRGPRANDDFPTPGDGEVDHRSLIDTLRAAGFTGPCMVEMVGGTTPEETECEARRACEHLRAIIGA
jgi:sugar phosphate isomerase/epimerase